MLLTEIHPLAGDPENPRTPSPVWVSPSALALVRPRPEGGSTLVLQCGHGIHVAAPFADLVARLRAAEETG